MRPILVSLRGAKMANDELNRYVYVLEVRRQFTDGQSGAMVIGYYTSIGEVEKAKGRLLERPAFRDFPDSFHVECYRLNTEYDDAMFFTHFPPSSTQS